MDDLYTNFRSFVKIITDFLRKIFPYIPEELLKSLLTVIESRFQNYYADKVALPLSSITLHLYKSLFSHVDDIFSNYITSLFYGFNKLRAKAPRRKAEEGIYLSIKRKNDFSREENQAASATEQFSEKKIQPFLNPYASPLTQYFPLEEQKIPSLERVRKPKKKKSTLETKKEEYRRRNQFKATSFEKKIEEAKKFANIKFLQDEDKKKNKKEEALRKMMVFLQKKEMQNNIREYHSLHNTVFNKSTEEVKLNEISLQKASSITSTESETKSRSFSPSSKLKIKSLIRLTKTFEISQLDQNLELLQKELELDKTNYEKGATFFNSTDDGKHSLNESKKFKIRHLLQKKAEMDYMYLGKEIKLQKEFDKMKICGIFSLDNKKERCNCSIF